MTGEGQRLSEDRVVLLHRTIGKKRTFLISNTEASNLSAHVSNKALVSETGVGGHTEARER